MCIIKVGLHLLQYTFLYRSRPFQQTVLFVIFYDRVLASSNHQMSIMMQPRSSGRERDQYHYTVPTTLHMQRNYYPNGVYNSDIAAAAAAAGYPYSYAGTPYQYASSTGATSSFVGSNGQNTTTFPYTNSYSANSPSAVSIRFSTY